MARNNVEIAVRGIDDASGTFQDVSRAANRAMSQVESSVQSIPDVDIDTSQAQSQLNDLQSTAQETENALGDIDLGAIAGGAATGAATGFMADIEGSAADLQAQLGTTREEAEKLRGIGVDVFSNNFAGSVGEATSAVGRLNQLTGAQGKALQGMTQDVFKVADAYDQDFNEVINAARANSQSMDISFSKALNNIAAGYQQIDKGAEDWLDTVNEYSPSFQRIGADGQEMIAIIQAGMKAGVKDTDKMADAVNEFGIKLQEPDNKALLKVAETMTDTDKEAQKLIDTWQSDFAKGGDAAAKVTQDVVSHLNDMDNQARNQAGVGLFGSMWEDTSGKVGEALDLANQKVIDSDKAIDHLGAKYDTASSKLESFGRSILGKVAGPLENMGPTLNVAAQGFSAVGTGMLAMKGLGITGLFAKLGPAIATAASATWGFTTALLANPITWIVAGIAALIAVIILLWKNWDTVSAFLVKSWQWIKSTAITVFTAIGQFLSNTWAVIWTTIKAVWNKALTYLSGIWTAIKVIATNTFNSMVSFFVGVWNDIWMKIMNVWNSVVTFLTSLWNKINAIATGVFRGIESFLSAIWNGIWSTVRSVWTTISNFVSSIWNNIWKIAITVFQGLESSLSSAWDSIWGTVRNVWTSIKSFMTGLWNGLSSSASSIFNGIGRMIAGVWNSVSSTTSRIWNGIVGSIKGAINTVVDAINGMLNSISGISISIPTIPDWVPGIGGMGGGSLSFPNLPNIPHLATGGVVKKPTIAQVGDAGRGNPEIVAPQKMIRGIIADELERLLGGFISNGGTTSQQPRQPLQLFLRLGMNDFEAFVEDITETQEKQDFDLRRFNGG
ncbi:phage tail tape measure protein [Halobacillus salinarum]|uniref:Phage tail tape measure protein n=1 Tax=Halobacillus salinarum TaxID=2932257 RepID=A0ABY4EFV7_9BACI|nr:phage tail tape measure protein [Halobacillus salinarum]UOQ43350.1 phage tail tape measure protein [Halobacillus salinarum]